jgi:hypothetical protein
MGEALQSSASNRDWRVHCYDAADQVAVCSIDSDHGAVRVGLTVGERERFFELRAGQVVEFQAALKATLGMIRIVDLIRRSAGRDIAIAGGVR